MQNQQSNSKGNSSTNKVSKGSQVAVNKPQKKSTGRGR